ncbi:MAG: MarR family transcriptional regulator [Gammaproteobacteria bacterium]|nr:MarR family transcriptional regulator [Gammaproteobacteria bacterium]
MRRGFLTSSRYSPGNLDRESLETLFVGRRDVMDDVLTRAKLSIDESQKHYLLLVGPRGSGKTHFLALAYHRLMEHIEAVGVADRVAVALLKEEEWGVASYLDLVVRILRALVDEYPELESQIADVYASFAKDPAEAEALANSLLREHTHRKTLMLLCENLADLLDGLGDEGQKRWRAAIQEEGNWAIVATTPQLFDALTLQEKPFFGFFTIRGLDPIRLETGIELLAKKAIHEGKADLAEFLRTPMGRARVRVIDHLTAGNPRAYVVLFDFLDKESLDDLVAPFMRLADDLTPYYQDRMRQLAPAQRKILEFLCRVWKPVTVKDISAPCLMSQQTAAKQIGELASAGFVARTRSGRNTFCELSDPLMRICIEVKDNNTGHFRLLVEFLRHWFTTRELQQDRVAELAPDDLALWVQRAQLAIERDAFDAAREYAAKLEKLPDGSLLGRLFAAQAVAASRPLTVALDALGSVEAASYKRREQLHRRTIVALLTVSLRKLGPRHLPEGLTKLRKVLGCLLEEGVLGAILTDFLLENVEGLAGTPHDWELALDCIAPSLDDLSDCPIPIEMLRTAVQYTKTGDEKHLLRLPLEQRELLREVLPKPPPSA